MRRSISEIEADLAALDREKSALFPPRGHAQVPFLYDRAHNERLNDILRRDMALRDELDAARLAVSV